MSLPLLPYDVRPSIPCAHSGRQSFAELTPGHRNKIQIGGGGGDRGPEIEVMPSEFPTLHVSLISGRSVSLQVPLILSVDDLVRRASVALAVGRGRVLNHTGEVLEGSATLAQCGLQSGDSLTLQIGQVRISTSQHAGAAILGDGCVVTWGRSGYGGDCSSVQHQLTNVHQIQASQAAFAAILGDGSVVTWGHARHGGDSSLLQEQLKNVQQVHATFDAFAAILGDGSVKCWGGTMGDSRMPMGQNSIPFPGPLILGCC